MCRSPQLLKFLPLVLVGALGLLWLISSRYTVAFSSERFGLAAIHGRLTVNILEGDDPPCYRYVVPSPPRGLQTVNGENGTMVVLGPVWR